MYEFWEIFEITFFIDYLRTDASVFDLLSSVRLLLDDTTLKQKLGLSSGSILSLLLLSRTKFMKQCQEIEQNWKGRENFYICFYILILEGRLGITICVHPLLNFSNIS